MNRILAVPLLGTILLACTGGPAVTPPASPGEPGSPRGVNVIARDYAFVPDVVDLVPGETVVIRFVNAGLDVHEAVIGDRRVQDAWEEAHAAAAGAPPGPTPRVEVPAALGGLRVVARSGERVDVVWTVPADAATAPGGYLVGCHIPGHWEKGMVVPVRFP